MSQHTQSQIIDDATQVKRTNTYLSEEHVGRETTFWSIGVYNHISALYLKGGWSGWGEVTLLRTLLSLTLSFDFFRHI